MTQTGLNPIEILKLYSGNGTFMLLFIVSLVYLMCFEKNKTVKYVLGAANMILLVLFVFPVFANVFMNKLDEESTYYRFLWIIPTGIVSSYAIVHFIKRFKNKFVKAGVCAVFVICILIGGVFMYEAPVFIETSNAYQIPDEVLEICQDIEVEGREVEAIFPDEILVYPRLYSSYIIMPYGFETLQFGKGMNADLHEAMIQEKIDVEFLFTNCELRSVHYVILNQNKTLDGDPADYNYEFVGSYGDYDLYKGKKFDL